MLAMIQPFSDDGCATAADQLGLSNRSTPTVGLDVPNSAEIWWGSLLYSPAATDTPNAYFSMSFIREQVREISVVNVPLSPFIFQGIGPSHHSYIRVPDMLPRASNGHATTGGHVETDMCTVLGVEGDKSLSSLLFETYEMMSDPSHRLPGNADIGTYEERRSGNQPPAVESVDASRDRDARVLEMAARKLYKCRSCGAEFSQSQGLSRHNKDKHEPRNPCQFCTRFTWSQGRLYSYKRHLQVKHPGVEAHHAQVTTTEICKKHHHS